MNLALRQTRIFVLCFFAVGHCLEGLVAGCDERIGARGRIIRDSRRPKVGKLKPAAPPSL